MTVELRAVDWDHHAHVVVDGAALCKHPGPWPSLYSTVAETWLCPECCSARQPYLHGLIEKVDGDGRPGHFMASRGERND